MVISIIGLGAATVATIKTPRTAYLHAPVPLCATRAPMRIYAPWDVIADARGLIWEYSLFGQPGRVHTAEDARKGRAAVRAPAIAVGAWGAGWVILITRIVARRMSEFGSVCRPVGYLRLFLTVQMSGWV